MPKAYWVVRVDVKDPNAYKDYAVAAAAAVAKGGGRFIARGGKQETMEGQSRPRNVIVEFKDFDAALACYRSPDYVKALKMRQACSDADFIILEGFDAPPV